MYVRLSQIIHTIGSTNTDKALPIEVLQTGAIFGLLHRDTKHSNRAFGGQVQWDNLLTVQI
eukprot:m.112132 g.112132  ORF g.112132 m.112132 type:complete len:61 (-) comp28170_c1_seq5:624-806(-)